MTASEAPLAGVRVDRRVSRVCPRCGCIHSSDDAKALNRFSASATEFVGKNSGIPRRTRQEAENDECAWRVRNNSQSKRVAKVATSPIQAELQLEAAQKKQLDGAPPFPAAKMEIAAREKAWLDFLAHANFSLMIWKIDGSIHSSIEPPTVWLSRCSDELRALMMQTANA